MRRCKAPSVFRISQVLVGVELLEGAGIMRDCRCRDSEVPGLDSTELVILLPQVGFDDFGAGQEAQDIDVSLGKRVLGERRPRQCSRQESDAGG
jgi:hypothetical protein